MKKYLAMALLGICLSTPAASQTGCPPDAEGSCTAPVGSTIITNGGYTINALVSKSLITQPSNLWLNCNPSCPATFGWDYDFTYQGVRRHVEFRVPYDPNNASPKIILEQFRQQWISNQMIRDAIGADIVDYARVRQEPGVTVQFQFFQSALFARDANPVAVTIAGLAGNQGNATLEVDPNIFFLRTVKALGREPIAGDYIGGIYWSGDTTTRAGESRNADPIYGSMNVVITDPATGRAKLQISIDEIEFIGTRSGPIAHSGAANCGVGGVPKFKNGLFIGC